MEEITTLGNSYFVNTITSKILPDRNLIIDVIENQNSFLVEIDEYTYNQFLLNCQQNLIIQSF